jgi:hypothetical protein
MTSNFPSALALGVATALLAGCGSAPPPLETVDTSTHAPVAAEPITPDEVDEADEANKADEAEQADKADGDD